MNIPYAELIGDPVAHSKSPLIHKFWLRKLGVEADYRATAVTAAELDRYMEQRRRDPLWCGCNITMPLKDAATDFVQPQSVHGPINVAVPNPESRCLRGENTDLVAFEILMRRALSEGMPTLPEAVVIGAGALARAILPAVVNLGFRTVHLLARDRGKAEALASLCSLYDIRPAGLPEALPAAGLVVNASAMGMGGAGATPSLEAVPEDAILFEAVYAPPITALLAAARARGLRTIDGLEMLVEQAAPAFRLFFGRFAPRQHDRELRELLTR